MACRTRDLPVLPQYKKFRLLLFRRGEVVGRLYRQIIRLSAEFALLVEQMVLADLEQVRGKFAGRLILRRSSHKRKNVSCTQSSACDWSSRSEAKNRRRGSR